MINISEKPKNLQVLASFLTIDKINQNKIALLFALNKLK